MIRILGLVLSISISFSLGHSYSLAKMAKFKGSTIEDFRSFFKKCNYVKGETNEIEACNFTAECRIDDYIVPTTYRGSCELMKAKCPDDVFTCVFESFKSGNQSAQEAQVHQGLVGPIQQQVNPPTEPPQNPPASTPPKPPLN